MGGGLTRFALLAQLVEQLTLNQRVLGSSPRWRTTRQGPGAGNDRANPLLPKSQSRAGNERCRHDDTLVQICGPLVKRSRHRPLTPVTRVRFPHGSPILWYTVRKDCIYTSQGAHTPPQGNEPVFITVRPHPFPSRTRKLSSPVPKILGGKLPGKIGLRRHP